MGTVYGWRSADVANLSKMQKGLEDRCPPPLALTISVPDFPGTQQIFLEENYRSTASILKLSLAIVSQGFRTHPTLSLVLIQTRRKAHSQEVAHHTCQRCHTYSSDLRLRAPRSGFHSSGNQTSHRSYGWRITLGRLRHPS